MTQLQVLQKCSVVEVKELVEIAVVWTSREELVAWVTKTTA